MPAPVRTLALLLALSSAGCATVNPYQRELDESVVGSPDGRTKAQWAEILRAAKADGRLQQVIEGDGQWVFAGGLTTGLYVDFEWHLQPEGHPAEGETPAYHSSLTIGRLRAEPVPGGTLEQQAQALGLELVPLGRQGRDLWIDTGLMVREYQPAAAQLAAGLPHEEVYRAATDDNFILLTENGRLVRVALVSRLSSDRGTSYQVQHLSDGQLEGIREQGLTYRTSAFFGGDTEGVFFKSQAKIAHDLKADQDARDLAASNARDAAEEKEKVRARAEKLAAERAVQLAALPEAIAQLKALVRARDLGGIAQKWPGIESLCFGMQGSEPFEPFKRELIQLSADLEKLLIDSGTAHEKRGLTGTSAHELWSVASLRDPSGLPWHPYPTPDFLQSLDDKGPEVRTRLLRLLGGLALELIPSVEGPLSELPGWYDDSGSGWFSGLRNLSTRSSALKAPAVRTTVGPWEGRRTAVVTQEPRTSRYVGQARVADAQAIAEWRAEIQEAEEEVAELASSSVIVEQPPATKLETGQEDLYSGSGPDRVKIGTRGFVDRETSASIEARRKYEANYEANARQAARSQAQLDGSRRSAAERLANLRETPPEKVLEAREYDWKYHAQCQRWTGAVSRTIKFGAVAVTQSVPVSSAVHCRVAADPAHNVPGSDEWISEEEAAREFVGPPDTGLPALFREKAMDVMVAERIQARIAGLSKKKGITSADLQREEKALRALFLSGPSPLSRIRWD